jgi:hypothetical protein
VLRRRRAAKRGEPISAGATIGLRRVDYIRVTVGGGRPVAEVTGAAHRYPSTVRVPLRTANRLAAAGIPLLVSFRPTARHPSDE